jgi:hypothetical protein
VDRTGGNDRSLTARLPPGTMARLIADRRDGRSSGRTWCKTVTEYDEVERSWVVPSDLVGRPLQKGDAGSLSSVEPSKLA